MIIRRLTSADEAQWRALWTGYLEFYNSTVPEEVYQTTFARLISGDRNQVQGFVAEDDGTLIGLVHYFYHAHGWKVEQVCYLQDLYADPAARGQGVGAALIEAVYAQADKDGAPSVYWMTQEFNHAARKLYDRIGTLTPFIKYQRPS
ncbi:GNAT family N-acetyltransferase [Cognatishimia sp. MH4019]|uniref:GNAT family N-acetyltransferase n=1 Tax=Cognatishimia sp. MH4019 TaxID=2854030 RepID=UPI001CD74952|nr:GNAT family N-acetyltransferase [Cognatishimia sp. MH4019]